MTLASLTSTHSVNVYSLTETTDDARNVRTTVGSFVGSKDCRVRPLSVKEKQYFDQDASVDMRKALFSSDPEITNDHCLVWNDKVYRVIETRNHSGVSWMWSVVMLNVPQAELEAP